MISLADEDAERPKGGKIFLALVAYCSTTMGLAPNLAKKLNLEKSAEEILNLKMGQSLAGDKIFGLCRWEMSCWHWRCVITCPFIFPYHPRT